MESTKIQLSRGERETWTRPFFLDESSHVSGNVKRPHPLTLDSQCDHLWKREHSLHTQNNVKLSSSCSTASAQQPTARVRFIVRAMSDALHVVPLSLKTRALWPPHTRIQWLDIDVDALFRATQLASHIVDELS